MYIKLRKYSLFCRINFAPSKCRMLLLAILFAWNISFFTSAKFGKTYISYIMIPTCAYQGGGGEGVRNVSFLESFLCVLSR